MNLKDYLNSAIVNALEQLNYDASNTLVSISNRPDLSDYQSNVAMPLARLVKKSPSEIANKIKEFLMKDSAFAKVTVDGPGFINVSFSDDKLLEINISPKKFKKKIVLDYGGPNIAKEMHVGHLRSAIIGESLKRILKLSGNDVIGDVHFGDWGTPIGMLITQLKSENPESFENNFENFDMTISEISALYKRASANFKSDDDFKEAARVATFELQNGNALYKKLWKILRDKSVEAVKANYDKLGVSFDLWLGESDTNEMLPKIVDDLLERNIAVHSNGAVIVPMDCHDSKQDGNSSACADRGAKQEKAPLILRKSDGAYTYAITDLATIVQRVENYNPDAILYVVDARQKEHFQQVFSVARRAGYVKETISLEHIAFGTVNGKDGKPFKTREGNVMNLKDLIEFSESKAREELSEVNEETEDQARKIAIGALKFQDLKNLRTSNYVFDTENFTKSEGKTGAYVQYAIARINSILEKSNEQDIGEDLDTVGLKISHKAEREILLQLNRFSESLEQAYIAREPSIISEYVYVLAQKFSTLYAELPINGENDCSTRISRLKLCRIIKYILTQGLDLLGIEAPEKMLR
ncbi:MAG: arginine--tRNA ligase [Alphaproteobacteria bacterium]|nr:arginine--tRNA ligase [Alphaproteobacteria bacterium]